jgi:hypothetical protein
LRGQALKLTPLRYLAFGPKVSGDFKQFPPQLFAYRQFSQALGSLGFFSVFRACRVFHLRDPAR